MHCSNCGKAKPTNIRFCPYCGAAVPRQTVTSPPVRPPPVSIDIQIFKQFSQLVAQGFVQLSNGTTKFRALWSFVSRAQTLIQGLIASARIHVARHPQWPLGFLGHAQLGLLAAGFATGLLMVTPQNIALGAFVMLISLIVSIESNWGKHIEQSHALVRLTAILIYTGAVLSIFLNLLTGYFYILAPLLACLFTGAAVSYWRK